MEITFYGSANFSDRISDDIPPQMKFLKYSYTYYNTELLSSKRYMLACAPIKDSDQLSHLLSLIRVFDERSLGSQGTNVVRFFTRKTKNLVRLRESAD